MIYILALLLKCTQIHLKANSLSTKLILLLFLLLLLLLLLLYSSLLLLSSNA